MNKNNTAAKAATVATTREAQVLSKIGGLCAARNLNPIGSTLQRAELQLTKQDADVLRICVKKNFVHKNGDRVALTELGATAAGIVVLNAAATTYEDAMKAPVQPSKAKLLVTHKADDGKGQDKKPAKKVDGESKLDWAYRRLRRTTFDFIVRKVKLNDDDRKALREELERVRHDYGSLRTAVESMNAAWNIDFEEILEEFFGHVIHPGSGNHGVRKAD